MEEGLRSRARLLDVQLRQLHQLPPESRLRVGPGILASVTASCQSLIVEAPAWSAANRIHKTLWKECLYSPLNVLRKQLRGHVDSVHIQHELKKRVDDGASVLRVTIAATVAALRVVASAADAATLIASWSLQSIYAGDLARYVGDLHRAMEHYHTAALLDPASGYAQNQLAVAARELSCRPLLWYHYARALGCPLPFGGVSAELLALSGEVRRTCDVAGGDARLSRLGSVGPRELGLSCAVIETKAPREEGSADATGRRMHTRVSSSSRPVEAAVLDVSTILRVFPCAGGSPSTLPLTTAAVSWVLERALLAAAAVREGGSSLEAIPRLCKQLCTDISRLLVVGDPCKPGKVGYLCSLGPMWLTRIVVIFIQARCDVGEVSSQGDYGLLLVFSVVACIARHCRAVLLQLRRRHLRSEPAPSIASADVADDASDVDSCGSSSDERGSLRVSPHAGEAVNQRKVEQTGFEHTDAAIVRDRVASLLAPLSVFALWTLAHLSALEGAAELHPTVGTGERTTEGAVRTELVMARRRVLAALAAATNAITQFTRTMSSCPIPVTAPRSDGIVLLENIELAGWSHAPAIGNALGSAAGEWVSLTEQVPEFARVLACNEMAAVIGGEEVSWIGDGPTSEHGAIALARRHAQLVELMVALAALPSCRLVRNPADGNFRTSTSAARRTAPSTGARRQRPSRPMVAQRHRTLLAAPSSDVAEGSICGETILPLDALLQEHLV
jgi:hypothetical protein